MLAPMEDWIKKQKLTLSLDRSANTLRVAGEFRDESRYGF